MATPTVYVICDQNCKYEGMTKEQILTAIAQALETGEISDVDTGFVTTIKTISGTPLRFFVGTQSEYDALSEDDKKNLFAIISNDTTKEGLLNSLATLQTDFTEFRDGVLSGAVSVAKATNAETANYAHAADNAINATNATNATNDGEGRVITETYANVNQNGVTIHTSTTVLGVTVYDYAEFPRGAIVTYFSAAIYHIGDVIKSGEWCLAKGMNDGEYFWGKSEKDTFDIKVMNDAVICGMFNFTADDGQFAYIVQIL